MTIAPSLTLAEASRIVREARRVKDRSRAKPPQNAKNSGGGGNRTRGLFRPPPRFIVQTVRGGKGVSAYVLDRAFAHKVVRSFLQYPGASSAKIVGKADRLADRLNRGQA